MSASVLVVSNKLALDDSRKQYPSVEFGGVGIYSLHSLTPHFECLSAVVLFLFQFS